MQTGDHGSRGFETMRDQGRLRLVQGHL
jgi:hypothetical protein